MLSGLSRTTRIGLSGCVLISVLWLQGNVVWHNTAHALHHHGPELMCKLDILIAEIGSDQHVATGCDVAVARTVTSVGLVASNTGVEILAYFSRAPPAVNQWRQSSRL